MRYIYQVIKWLFFLRKKLHIVRQSVCLYKTISIGGSKYVLYLYDSEFSPIKELEEANRQISRLNRDLFEVKNDFSNYKINNKPDGKVNY